MHVVYCLQKAGNGGGSDFLKQISITESLANLDKAKLLIEQARDITEVLQIREKAIAVQAYAQARKSDELAKLALVVKLRTERKAGQFLKEMKKDGKLKHGGQNKKARSQIDNSLNDLKINPSESSRWQKMAAIPEKKFEEWVGDKAYKTSQNKILKNARDFVKEEEQRTAVVKGSDKLPSNIKIIHGKFQDASNQIAKNSIELIFTDPPYLEENLPIYSELASFASRHLVNNGSLITFCNEGQVDRIIDLVKKEGMDFWAILTIKMTGPYARIWKQGLVVKGKHLLWFVKGGKRLFPKQTVDNLIESSIPDKTYHDWAQSTKEGEFIIRCLTSQHGIVCDPFLGQGSFGISAKITGRNFIGIEIDKRHYENAKRLIAGYGGKEI